MIQITERIQADHTILTVSGRFDIRARQPFQAGIEHAKRSNPRQVTLNLTEVSYINSVGIGLLLLAHKNLEEANIRFSLEISEGYVAQILAVTHVDDIIPIVVLKTKPASSPPAEPSPSTISLSSPPDLDSPEMVELLLPFLECLEKKDFDLPPLSEVARKVLALTTDSNATMEQLTALIEPDPILTAKIFKLTNSAAYGTHREIESLTQAIAWLGLNTVAGIAFALAIQDGVFNDRGYEKEVRALWAHAIATGFYAKTLADMIEKNQDSAFLCGLLHSIGKFFVVHTVNLSHSSSTPPLPWSTMLTLIEQSYVEVGRQLAEAWNFPPAVKEAINIHQHYSYHLATHPSNGAALTCLAKHLATYHLDSLAITEPMLRALPVTVSLRLPPDGLNRILATKSVIQAQVDSLLL